MTEFLLRDFRNDDFAAFHALVCEYDVVKMTSGWPWPADPAYTRRRMNTPEARAGLVQVVDLNGEYIGQVAVVNGVLGYMIAKPHWGKGAASWAVAQQLHRAFTTQDVSKISACVWAGNPASEAILAKNGFVKTGEAMDFCKPRGEICQSYSFELNRADWLEARG